MVSEKVTNVAKGISIFSLVMLISGAIDSVRNLPTTALFGSTLIFFFIISALVFLIPAGLVSAELAAKWPEKGGIYEWMKKAFGKKTAFFAIWLQWINTLVWYPTILSFIAGTAAFLINPQLAANKLYLVTIILSVFWFLTFINLKGIQTSAKFVKYTTVIGMIVPMFFIIGLFFVWLFTGQPLQIHLTSHDLFPSLHHSESWISLTAIMTAFLGMELATVHVNHVHNPQKNFPKALFYSSGLILITMILGSLAIASVLPVSQINLVDGIMQAFTNYFEVFHLSFLMPLLVIALLIGSLGSMINWIISPAKGLLHAAQDGFLPKFLQQENKYGVAQNLLLLQAIIVTLVCVSFLFMPSVNGSYWLLTDLSTELYMLMYVFMFVAAIMIKHKYQSITGYFAIPGGIYGTWMVAGLGVIGSLITLLVGFFPPDGIDVGGFMHFETMFTAGLIAMILPIILFYFAAHRKRNKVVIRSNSIIK